MSQAALDLLASDTEDSPPEPASKRAIALLEGRAQPTAEAPQRSSLAMPRDPRSARNVDLRRNEAVLSATTGLAGAAVGGVAGIGSELLGQGNDEAERQVEWWKQALTYQPRSDVGEQALENFGAVMEHPANPLSWPGHLGEFAGKSAEEAGWNPALSTMMRMAPEVIPALFGRPSTATSVLNDVREAAPKLRQAAETIADVRELPPAPGATDSLTGFGADTASAAAASRINAAKNISPELLEDLRAQVQRGPLDPAAIDRQIDADALPVRMQLMQGQASKDPEVWSHEFNAKGKDPQVAARFNEQNQQLIDNLDEFRRQAAPEAVAHDPVQSGQNIVDAYKRYDETATADISQKYTALREAAEQQGASIDAQAFVANSDKALKKSMKGRFVPGAIAADLEDFRAGGAMDFEQFENLRTNLAAEGRKAERGGDGNAAAAISIVREQLEALPLTGNAAKLKPLADAARKAAKARFDRLRAEPAYKAAVEDDVGIGEASPLADKFVQKYIVGAPRAHVTRMMETLGADGLAMETVRAAPFNYMKAKAGIDPYRNEGNFSQHGYNRALAELEPKLDLMVGEDLADQARRLGRVAYDVKGEPAGSFPNRLNTFIAATAEAAKGLAERSANTLIGGNIVPVGSWAREKLNARTAARESKERMRPAAGTLAKPKGPP